MNIETSKIKKTQDVQAQNKQTSKQNNEESSVKFADELKNVAKIEETNKKDSSENTNNNNENNDINNGIKNDRTQENKDTIMEFSNNFSKIPDTSTKKDNANNISINETLNKQLEPNNETNPNEILNKPQGFIEETEPNKTLNNQMELNNKTKSNELLNKPQELHNKISLEDLNKNKEVKEELTIIDTKPKKKNLFEKSNLETETKSQTVNLDSALDSMNAILKEFNQSDDKNIDKIKEKESLADKNNMINNDFNIQENKDLMPQMNLNMNFSGDGQPFSSFMNDEKDQKKNNNRILGTNAQDLAEEAAILSTMSENIAIANKNQLVNETKIVVSNEGVKKVDTKTNIKIEDIVKYDSIIMNQADVEVFANIVEKGEIDVRELTTKGVEKSVQISKTLADLLAKAMNDNQPIRINFDNNISVIIRISREGKLTADFLPSSQVAEAYLKENLPLLRQRFDDNNIDYDSLNQRERKEQNRENNKKKGRNNE